MNAFPSGDQLSQYKQQLLSVEEALKSATPDNKSELQDLKEKLTEVITLLGGSPLESESSSRQEPEVSKDDDIDDEFLRFQREINLLENSSGSKSIEEDVLDDEDNAAQDEFCSVLSSMEGNKCRAPYMQEWGEKAYHNALIFSTDLEDQDISNLQDVLVKVMFCNPTCDKMKPCPFFLDGHCKFSDGQCRYSHGFPVKFSDLEEYHYPDYSNVQRDSRCLAKYKDGLWYQAVVENCLKDNKYCVKYTVTKSTDTLAAHDILPLGSMSLSDDDSSGDSSGEDYAYQPETANPKNGVTEINYEVVAATSPMGTWEQHTKGIGSKLMAKMGYVWGQGLGKNSNGRLEPVEAVVLPKGKSLDKCVELREITGLESVEDRFSSEQRKEQRRAKNIESYESPESSVFAFLNKNVSIRDDYKGTENTRKRSSMGSENSSSNSQQADLNFEMYAVGESIKKAKKEIFKLQQSVTRNSDRNESACSQMKQKMSIQTNILRDLEAKERRISEQINKKKNHKKIAVF